MAKKITPQQYAEAFSLALEDKKTPEHRIVENFIALVQKNGDWARRRHIFESCEDAMRRKDGRKLVSVEAARPLSQKQRTRITKMFRDTKIDVEERISPELIAGIKITVDRERQLDGTLKHKLDTILEHV